MIPRYTLLIMRPDWFSLERECIDITDLAAGGQPFVASVEKAAREGRIDQEGEYRVLVTYPDGTIDSVSAPIKVTKKVTTTFKVESA